MQSSGEVFASCAKADNFFHDMVGSKGRGVSPYFVRKVEFQENNGIQSISTTRMNDIGKKQSEKNSDIFTSMRIQVTYHLSVQIFLCYSLWTTFAIMHGRDYAVMMATNGIASLVYGIGIAIFIRYARPEIRAHTHFSCSVCLIVLIIYIICASLLDRDITYPAVGFSCSALNIWDEIYVLWSDVRTVRATHTATHLFFDVVFLPTLKGGILVAYSYLKKSIFFMVTYSVVFLVGIGRLYLYFCYPRNQIANSLDNDQELVDHLSGEHVENRRGDIEAPPELDTQEERSGDVEPPRELGSQQEQRSGDVEPPRELGTQQEQRSGDVEPPRELGTQQEQELEADVHYLIKCVGLFFIWLIIYFIPLVFEL